MLLSAGFGKVHVTTASTKAQREEQAWDVSMHQGGQSSGLDGVLVRVL